MKEKAKTMLSDLGLFYAAAIWGSTFFIVKDSLRDINAITLVGYRFIFAAIIMLAILFFMKKKAFSNFKYGFILGILLWLLYIPQTIGLNYTTASNSGFITSLFILFLPVFSLLFFRIVPGIQKIISIIFAVFGLWLLTGGLKDFNLGDLLTLSAALSYSIHILLADKFVNRDIDPYVLSFQQFFTVGFLSFILAFFMEAPIMINSSRTFITIIFLTLFPTVSAFVIQLVAQKHTTPIKVGLIFTMVPVFAAIFAWSYGGEAFILEKALGGLLIVVAMIMSELQVKNIFKKKAL